MKTLYSKSKYYTDYCVACEDARKNIKDQAEYAKCITALNNYMDWQLIRENIVKPAEKQEG